MVDRAGEVRRSTTTVARPRTWDTIDGGGEVVATAIHNGHEIRPELLAFMALDDAGRRREEDPHTGALAGVVPTHVVVHRSRFEVDLNRDLHEAICLAPDDCWELEVWSESLGDDVLQPSRDLYVRFYREFEALLRRVEQRHGRFVVLDLHSYNHRRNGPNAPPGDPVENPEVNVGTGSMDRAQWGPVVDRFMADLSDQGLDVRENVKFRGRRLARFVHETFPLSGCCPAIEFKKTFMDEHTGWVDRGRLETLKDALAATVPGLRESLRVVERR